MALQLTTALAAIVLAPESAGIAQEIEEPAERDEIVILGNRTSRDDALSSDRSTDLMSQSSRSLEQDILRALAHTD